MSSKGSGIRVIVFDEHEKIHSVIRNAMIESVESFYHLSTCVTFIEQNAQDNRATVIVTTSINDRVLAKFEHLDPVEAILILSPTERPVHTFVSKVVGAYAQIEELLRALFTTLDALEFQLDANSLLFHQHADGSDNTDFYFYDLWKMHQPKQIISKKVLIDHARLLFRSEDQIKAAAHEFNTSYKSADVLFWLDKYTHPFPYHLLVCNALRTHDQQILSLIRFFILDLTRHMKLLPVTPSYNQVFFGTKLPIAIVDRLEQQTSKDIIAFQCFLPVTKSRAHALEAATRPTRRRKIGNVLFRIDATSALCAPMGDIILIDMATPFHVTRVARNTGSGGVQQLVTVVTLVALDLKHREQLLGHFIQKQKKAGKNLYDFIQKTIVPVRADNSYERESDGRLDISKHSIPVYVVSASKTDRDTLSISHQESEVDSLISHQSWDQAANTSARVEDSSVHVLNEQGCSLRERLRDLPGALECHQKALEKATDGGRAETLMHLGLVRYDMKDYDEALTCFSEALTYYEKKTHRDPTMIARCLVGLGNVHWASGRLDEALDCEERALVLREQEIQPRNAFDIAACLGNMGNILHDQGDIERALDCAKRAVDILSSCAKGDPRLCAGLNNLGVMYQASGDYDKAREYFERALMSLPDEDHPHRKSTMNNIARLNAIENAQE